MSPSQPSYDTAEEEIILFSVSCLRHKGLLAYSGVLELTPGQLRFRPLSGSRKVSSNLTVLIPTEYVRGARILGSEGHLFIRAGKEKLRFSGLQVQRFHYRLRSLIAQLKGAEAHDIPHFDGEERVLAFGSGTLTTPEEGKKYGEVMLTDTRLRFFEYQSRRKKELNPMPIFGLGLDQIDRFQLEGLRQDLRLDSSMGTSRIKGPTTIQVYALLSNLCRPQDYDEDGPTEDRSSLARTGPAVRIRRLRRTQGLLVIGGDAIQFVPTGVLNILMGSRPVNIPFSQLYEGVRSKSSSLTLIGQELPVHLIVDDCEGWFRELITQIQDWLEHRTQAGSDGEAGSKLDSWRFRVNRQAIDEAPLVLPIVRRSDISIHAGMLSFARNKVHLSQLIDGSEAPFLTLDPMNLQRVWDDLADGREIIFTHHRERFTLTAAGGADSVDNFWARCRTPSRVFTGEYLEDQAWLPILGLVQFIKIIPQTGPPIEMRSTRLLKHADGLGMIVPGDPDECTFLGQTLEIHFSHTEGMCEFETIAVWASPPPSSISISRREHSNFMLLIVEPPAEIRAFNARRSFRVPAVQRVKVVRLGMDEETQGTLTRQGDPLDGTLVNISAIGSAFICDTPIEPETVIELILTIEGRALPVQTTVVRNREVEGEDESIMWEHGLTFLNLDRGQTNTITKAVRQVQLHLLAQQEKKT